MVGVARRGVRDLGRSPARRAWGAGLRGLSRRLGRCLHSHGRRRPYLREPASSGESPVARRFAATARRRPQRALQSLAAAPPQWGGR
eukprot:3793775-Prymnesium_polylepis.1